MKAETTPPASSPTRRRSPLLWTTLLLVIILSLVFRQSFDSRYVAFSNDGPLGQLVSEENKMPSILKGLWVDLNWLGSEGLSPAPGIATALRWVTSPQAYLNLLYPAALFIAGISACYCLRRFKLSPLACILGGLAAALNSDFFSTACWGVATQIIGFGANYFALGLIAGPRSRRRWVRLILAGLAVGMGIMEAYDIGALFSLFIAAFVLYQALFLSDEVAGPAQKFGRGVMRIVVVALFAAIISVHSLTMLTGTQIQGVVGTAQDAETKQKHWDIATQWSLPKIEIAQLFVPGVFGYRMESTNGDNYWGQIGRSPSLDAILKQRDSADANTRAQMDASLKNSNLWRFSGTGLYAGVLVLVVALWAVLQSCRKRNSPYSRAHRRIIWFWTVVLLVTVPLAFGRYAPFYQFFYALPYASTIRNPTKFMHVFSWALIIVFGFGVDGLYRMYMQNPAVRAKGIFAQFKSWFATATPFDKKWIIGSVVGFVAALVGWLIYSASSDRLKDYIVSIGIDPIAAPIDARFSQHAVGWFVFFLATTLSLLTLIISGQFSGPRAKWGGALLGVLLLADLIHADVPWPRYWDVAYKYASNPIVDILKDKPWEHRVVMNPVARQSQQLGLFQEVYTIEWQQQVFPYYDIQSLEVVMEPRLPVDKDMFMRAIPPTTPANLKRQWELTNTRYIVGLGGGVVDYFNQNVDPEQKRFHLVKSFNVAPKPGTTGFSITDYTAVPAAPAELGLIEYTGVLPRASLIANWQVNTNDDATLQTVAAPTFDVHQLVLVSTNLPVPPPTGTTNSAGSVEITNYKSKRIELSADVKSPCVLLLVERYNPKWLAEVDGKPAPVLRCDFILRGVFLEPGQHKIVLRYVTSMKTLYVSVAATFLGLCLCGILVFGKRDLEDEDSAA